MAKIVGNIVGLPNPQPDWNQTDKTKADYIKNKPAITDVVHKTGDEQIQGIKDFVNGLKTAKITSDGQITIEATDAPVTISANDEYTFYDGTIYINGKDILTDSPKYDSVSAEQITTKKIQGNTEDGNLEIETDGMEINSSSAIFIRTASAISLEGEVYINNEIPATREYVDEKTNVDVIEVDAIISKSGPLRFNGTSVTLEGMLGVNIVTGSGVASVNGKEIALKEYVDKSIQQAIIDSWEVEV